MLYYHGTTKSEALHLLKGGEKESSLWNCSYDDYLYVWSHKALAEANDLEETEGEEFAIRQGFVSAQIAAAKKAESEMVVLAFDFPEDQVFEDCSCDNMDGAKRVPFCDYKRHLVKTFFCRFNVFFAPFVLRNLKVNQFFNLDNLNDDLKQAIEAITDSELGEEFLYEFEWEERGTEI